ncbi:hypothetical protein TNCV_2857351 [Trichonephila clavipes]|nr:hypothetical protein TNCV_2857351 [Trichonephila clavipes]
MARVPLFDHSWSTSLVLNVGDKPPCGRLRLSGGSKTPRVTNILDESDCPVHSGYKKNKVWKGLIQLNKTFGTISRYQDQNGNI